MRQFVTSFSLLCIAVALAGCKEQSTPTPQPPAPPIQKSQHDQGKLIDDTWSVNFLRGSRFGYGHATIKRIAGPDGDVVRTTVKQVMRVKREGQATEETLTFECDDSPQGKILSFSSAASAMKLESQGKVAGGMLKITTTTEGKTSVSVIPWDDDTLGYCGVDDSLRRQPMKVGDKRVVKSLQPLLHIISEDSLEAVEEEDVELLGESKRLLRIKADGTLGKLGAVHRTLWADEEGIIWKSLNAETGEEIIRTTEERAKEKGSGAFDLTLATIVKVDRKLENPHGTRRIVYRTTLKHRNPAEVFAKCPSQLVKPIDDRTAELTVRRVTANDPQEVDPKPEPPGPGDSTPNNFIQSDDELVQKMAASIAGDETDAEKVAFLLENGVRQRLTDKNYSTTFATAADVAKSLSGDCTEHSVLLAALLRARKVPARVVAGLIYVQENSERKRPQGFAYHMWTEAWLNDRWVPLDATLGKGGIGAAHVKLSDSNLDGVSPLESLLPVMNVLGQLELEIVEVE